MSLSLDLAAAILPLMGQSFVPARAVSVSDTQGLSLSVTLLSVESVGIACEELHLTVPSLSNSTLDLLKRWATGLCRRVTYLLEGLGPLEFDASGQQVLIRSVPPDQTSGPHTKYYEVLLSATGAGRFVLRRYEADRTTGGRRLVPLRLTHEQLAKLVNDLVDTLPSP